MKNFSGVSEYWLFVAPSDEPIKLRVVSHTDLLCEVGR